MKKMIVSLLFLIAFLMAAFIAYENYMDILAVGLAFASLIPSAVFVDGLKEYTYITIPSNLSEAETDEGNDA